MIGRSTELIEYAERIRMDEILHEAHEINTSK